MGILTGDTRIENAKRGKNVWIFYLFLKYMVGKVQIKFSTFKLSRFIFGWLVKEKYI